MTWDELVFRPLTADPFIYKGTGDVDPVEEPGGGRAVLRPDVYEAIRKDQGGRIYDPISGSGDYNPSDRDGSTVVVNPGRDPNDPLLGGGTQKTKVCYRPVAGKHLWIKPPPHCVLPGENPFHEDYTGEYDPSDPNSGDPRRAQKLALLRALKECYGFASISLGMSSSTMIFAGQAGLTPRDITLNITPCKLRDAGNPRGSLFDEFCNNGDYSYSAYVTFVKKALEFYILNLNIWFGNYSTDEPDDTSKIVPFRRIWMDEPGTDSGDFTCDNPCSCNNSCGNTIGDGALLFHDISAYVTARLTGELWQKPIQRLLYGVDVAGALFEAISQLRREGSPLVVANDELSYSTEFVISNYSKQEIGFGIDYLAAFNGLSDVLYTDKYDPALSLDLGIVTLDLGHDQLDEWDYPGVQAAILHLDKDDQEFDLLFSEANKRGWSTLGLFATKDRNENEYTDCRQFFLDLQEFLLAAVRQGWLERYVKFG